jgi:hypothetical protein
MNYECEVMGYPLYGDIRETNKRNNRVSNEQTREATMKSNGRVMNEDSRGYHASYYYMKDYRALLRLQSRWSILCGQSVVPSSSQLRMGVTDSRSSVHSRSRHTDQLVLIRASFISLLLYQPSGLSSRVHVSRGGVELLCIRKSRVVLLAWKAEIGGSRSRILLEPTPSYRA